MNIKAILIINFLFLLSAQAVTAQKPLLKNYHLDFVISDMAPLVEADNDLNFYISDLVIIQRADSLLSDTARWNRQDDRDCGDDIANGKYSLFCALYKASIDVAGEYLHRRTVMQAIRFIIGKDFRSRFNHHRLMDFNNNPETTFQDVKEVLKKTREIIISQLNEKEEVLKTVHRFYDAINRQDSMELRNIIADAAVNHYVADQKGPVPTGERLILSIKKQGMKEKISGDAFVKVNNQVAMAWIPYQVSGKEKDSSYGTTVFTFIKSKKGWLITSLTSSTENDAGSK
jgi:hypothetical protein